MPAIKGSAEKRHRQSLEARLHNKAIKSEVRTSIRKFLETAQSSDKAAAEKCFLEMQKLLDSAAQKGVFHKNTIARKKSRMAHVLNKLTA